LKENFKNFFHSFKLLFILKREFLLSRVGLLTELLSYSCAIAMFTSTTITSICIIAINSYSTHGYTSVNISI